jgi:hypothetical protein
VIALYDACTAPPSCAVGMLTSTDYGRCGEISAGVDP